jgi:hypothetical protein
MSQGQSTLNTVMRTIFRMTPAEIVTKIREIIGL